MKKMLSRRELVLIKKDFSEIWNERGIRILMILTPVTVAILVPIFFILLAILGSETEEEFFAVLKLLPPQMQDYAADQAILYVAFDIVMPMLFLIIPITVGSMATSVFFAGEMERNTMETLLTSAMPAKKIGRVKWLSSLCVAELISLASFIVFTLIGSVGDIVLGIRFFMNLSWIIIIILMSPLLAVLSVMLTVINSKKTKKQSEAYKFSVLIIFPIVLFNLLQFTGLYMISEITLVMICIALVITDIILIKKCEKNFTTEKMLM